MKTLRNHVEIRYTTDPADIGYGGKKTAWLVGKPDVKAPVASAVCQWREIKRKHIGNVFYGLDMKWSDGTPTNLDELTHMLAVAENIRYESRRSK